MAAPVVTSQTYSKANYQPGEVMTLTVNHTDVDRKTVTTQTTVTDSTGATGTGPAVPVVIDGAASVVPVSTPAVTWTLVAATLNQSVFTGIAP
jgi:hypothetical protein